MNELTLYSMPTTRAGRVRWVLEELELPYREVVLDRPAGEHRQPAFLAVNPLGRVPTLVDGDQVLTESAAICLHLAERDPERRLVPPAGGADRARLLMWLFHATSELEAPLNTAFVLTVRMPEGRRVPAVVPWCRERFDDAARVLDQRLEGRATVLDSGFGVADIVLACVLSWARDEGFLDPFPRLEAYRQRHLARPAALRAFASDQPS